MAELKSLIVNGASRFLGDIFAGNITVDSIKKVGGTSSQCLMADGSVATLPNNTHYTTGFYVGASTGASNAAQSNPYLKIFDDSTLRGAKQVIAGNGISVSSDASGNITITNTKPDVNHNTDTKNTAGSTNSSSKLFLIGATSQAANPQTYSDSQIYSQSGTLTTNEVKVGGSAGATMTYDVSMGCVKFII